MQANYIFIKFQHKNEDSSLLLEEMFIHFLLYAVNFIGTDNKTMERSTHVFSFKKLHRSRHNLLVLISDAGKSKTFCLLVIRIGLPIFLNFQQLLHALFYCHESGRFIDLFVLQYILLRSLFNFDVDQYQSMKVLLSVGKYFIVEAIRSPFLCPKWNRYSLSESVYLKSSAPNCTDDAGIVNNFNLYAKFNCS